MLDNPSSLSKCKRNKKRTRKRRSHDDKHLWEGPCHIEFGPVCRAIKLTHVVEEHPMNNNDINGVALAQHLLYHSKGEMLRREQRNKGMAEKHTKSLV